MRVLHVSKFYPPHYGGIEDVCYNLVTGLLNECEQKVICFNDASKTEISNLDGVEVIRVDAPIQLAKQPISIAYLGKLRHLLKIFNPDIIHLHLPNPLICFYLLLLNNKHTKIILHWHSDIVLQKKLYKVLSFVESKILKKGNKIIATSPNYIEYSLPLANYKEKCIVIPNMISCNKLDMDERAQKKMEKHLAKNQKIIFFIGRHVEYKGLKYLLEAEKYISTDCHIYIAGIGPLTNSLKKQNTSERIHFIGKIPDEDIKIYMNAASIFAFPSITKNEAFGVALAEAMYCKAVPVTFTIEGSGVNWVNINGETGLEVENRNSRKFGEAIDLLLQNDELRNQYAENAHKRVLELFTMKTIKKQVLDLYKSVLSE